MESGEEAQAYSNIENFFYASSDNPKNEVNSEHLHFFSHLL